MRDVSISPSESIYAENPSVFRKDKWAVLAHVGVPYLRNGAFFGCYMVRFKRFEEQWVPDVDGYDFQSITEGPSLFLLDTLGKLGVEFPSFCFSF